MDTINSTALSTLTQDERALLQADREKMGGGSLPTIPLIRLANKDMTQAPEGEYFTELRKGRDEEPETRQIGGSPKVTILYKTNTYSYYTPEDGLIAWTSDIHGFSPLDHVTLYKKKEGKAVIDFDGSWPDFKQHMEQKYVQIDPMTDRRKKLMKFRTVLYVLFEGKPHKMFVSNASSAGVDSEGKPSFDSPQKQSLQAFTDACWNEKRALYEYSCTLGSRFIESSKPYYIMTFGEFLELPETELAVALRAGKATQQAIFAIDDIRKRNAMEVTEHENVRVFGDDPSSSY
jgi:hypothetical protein